MTVRKWVSGGSAALSLAAALGSSGALANTQTYTGANCGAPSCVGNNFGNLTLPANVTFSDNPLSQGTTTDDWYFMVGPSALGTSITGDQVSFTMPINVSGTVDSFQLWTTNGLGGPLAHEIASGTVTSQFSQYILDPSISNGDYALVVQSTVNPLSTGNYTGSLVAQAVPLPASGWLLGGALGCLALLGLRSRREGVPAAARYA